MNLGGIGVGTDIESFERFKTHKEFIAKVFTKKEIQNCFSKKIPAQHLAARFAGKVAVKNAFHNLGLKPPKTIEIINNKKGIPFVKLEGFHVKISLSHCKDKALAFVILMKES